MTDEQRYALLTEFANSLSVVQGGNIKVTINPNVTSYEPSEVPFGMKFEDCNFLSETLKGAEQLLYFFAREGYEVKKTKFKSVVEMVENISTDKKFVKRVKKMIAKKEQK